MKEIGNSVTGGAVVRHGELEKRIFRSMACAVAIAVLASLLVGPWRVTTGLFFGGILSLVNYRWLHGTVAAILNVHQPGQKLRPKVWKHAFRYLIIAAAVFVAYKFRLVSLPATLVGLSSFVVALFVEAFREVYFSVIRREESY